MWNFKDQALLIGRKDLITLHSVLFLFQHRRSNRFGMMISSRFYLRRLPRGLGSTTINQRRNIRTIIKPAAACLRRFHRT
jgi:hypothetical protein